VYEWQPGRGFAQVAGDGITGDNGVAISGDGKWLYFNWFFGRAVTRVPRASGGEPATARLDFLPDNIDYAPDGSLYVTGQNADPKQLMAGCPSGDCLHGTTIIKLDPTTMKTRVIARLPPNPIFSDGTTALQVGDRLFLGSYRGDAVAYMKAPKQ
jgi:sugar lactone lactonase YvrE